MYTKKYIDVITLALVIIIFILINIYQFQIQGNIEKLLNPSQIQGEQELSKVIPNNELNNTSTNEIVSKTEKEKTLAVVEEVVPENWYIKIPSISLIAPIQQGTTTEILNKSVDKVY